MCGTVPMWHYAGLGRYCRWAGPLLNEGIHLDLDTWIVNNDMGMLYSDIWTPLLTDQLTDGP